MIVAICPRRRAIGRIAQDDCVQFRNGFGCRIARSAQSACWRQVGFEMFHSPKFVAKGERGDGRTAVCSKSCVFVSCLVTGFLDFAIVSAGTLGKHIANTGNSRSGDGHFFLPGLRACLFSVVRAAVGAVDPTYELFRIQTLCLRARAWFRVETGAVPIETPA